MYVYMVFLSWSLFAVLLWGIGENKGGGEGEGKRDVVGETIYEVDEKGVFQQQKSNFEILKKKYIDN